MLPVLLVMLVISFGCGALKRFAIGKLGDTLASSGSVYESDDDPDLVGDAIPFGLKLIESLLAEAPRNQGLLLAACKGFATYSYAYVQLDADMLAVVDLAAGKELRERARKLYRRARRYCIRGLEVDHAGIGERLAADPKSAVLELKTEDVPLLYWTAGSLGLDISVSRNDAEMLALIPDVSVMIGRALLLDESWDDGALHDVEIVLAGARPGAHLHELPRIKEHFDRALELSGGQRASLFVTYAEAVAVRTQDSAEFESLLKQALAVDPDQNYNMRLANLLAQRRARWLLSRIEELFLEPKVSGFAEEES